MTTTIEILNNVRCRITGVPKPLLLILDEALAIPIPGAHYQETVQSGRWDGKRHLFYADRAACSGTFPKGLLPRVESLLAEASVAFSVEDKRKPLPPPDLTRLQPDMLAGGITLRDYQIKAARRALKAGCGILWLATNAGKTEVASALLKVLKERRALFLVHTKTLLGQSRARIAKRLGTIEEHIGVIGEGRFDPKHITVATIQSLTRKTTKDKAAIIAKYLKTIELLIVDEGHHTKATTWYRLINRTTNAAYRYILSGTPFGSGNGLMVEAAVGPVVAKVSNKTLVRLGVSAVPTIKFIEINEPKIDAGMAWTDVYKEGIVLNTARNSAIAREVAQFVKDKKPTLVLVKELWHGDMLATMFKSLKLPYAFVHGKMPLAAVEQEKARFENGRISVLLASPIFDEGVDVPAIRALVIADGGKSVRSVLQKIGRGLRRKDGDNALDVVDFADNTHKWLAAHSLERMEIYKGEGFQMT